MSTLYPVLGRSFGFEIVRNGAAVAQVYGLDRKDVAESIAALLEERVLSELPRCQEHGMAPNIGRFQLDYQIKCPDCEIGILGESASQAIGLWKSSHRPRPTPIRDPREEASTSDALETTYAKADPVKVADLEVIPPLERRYSKSNQPLPPRSDAETIAELLRQQSEDRKLLAEYRDTIRALEIKLRNAREEAAKQSGDAALARREADRLRDSEPRIELGALQAQLAEAKAELEARPKIATREIDEILERLRKSEVQLRSALNRTAELQASVNSLEKSLAEHVDQIERFRVSQMKARAILRTVDQEDLSPALIQFGLLCALTIVGKDEP